MKRAVLAPFALVAASSLAAPPPSFYPVSTSALEVVAHKDYALGYCEAWEQAAWVVELLTPSMFAPNFDRSSGFRSDPLVSTGSAVSSDYTNSGFDRGHLAPAADFTYDDTAMYESFYMSNVSPQAPNLNRGSWAALEDWVRRVASLRGSLVVVTGPVITGEVSRIGKNAVAVPHAFFKVVYSDKPPKMTGFVYANRAGENAAVSNHAVSVDFVEALVGLDFFAAMPEAEQAALESDGGFSGWDVVPKSRRGLVVLIR